MMVRAPNQTRWRRALLAALLHVSTDRRNPVWRACEWVYGFPNQHGPVCSVQAWFGSCSIAGCDDDKQRVAAAAAAAVCTAVLEDAGFCWRTALGLTACFNAERNVRHGAAPGRRP